jgi:SAM-dependent methyltransferase
MANKEKYYPESQFGGFTDVDGTVTFFNRVNALLQPSFIVLDVGCGRGAYGEDPVPLRRDLRILKGKVAKVIGIDVDENARANPFVDEFYQIDGSALPIANDSIDLIVCDNVMEHVANPQEIFREFRRVLRNGGYLCIRTPNRWSYSALAATMIPNKYHAKVTAVVQRNRKEEDVFPTLYRCNSLGKMRSMMKQNGFNSVVYGHDAEPAYLSFSRTAYFFGVVHQKLAPGFLRPVIYAFGKLMK